MKLKRAFRKVQSTGGVSFFRKRVEKGRNQMKKSTLKYAFLSSLPVMAGYLVLGIGFGVLLQDKGYGWWWAALMSFTIYAGSMQYVAVDLLSGGATVVATALMTVLVNIRHLFYGLTMLEKYSDTGRRKPYLIFSLTDETFSLVCAPQLPEDVDEKDYYFYISLMNQSYWVAGSVIGAVAGAALSFNSAGIDFAMTALFVVIFVEQWEKTKQHLPAISGVVISIVCRLLFGASGFLIPSMIGITAAMFLEKRWLKGGDEQ
jgi:4-azaleucine resistance transporter AzlC